MTKDRKEKGSKGEYNFHLNRTTKGGDLQKDSFLPGDEASKENLLLQKSNDASTPPQPNIFRTPEADDFIDRLVKSILRNIRMFLVSLFSGDSPGRSLVSSAKTVQLDEGLISSSPKFDILLEKLEIHETHPGDTEIFFNRLRALRNPENVGDVVAVYLERNTNVLRDVSITSRWCVEVICCATQIPFDENDIKNMQRVIKEVVNNLCERFEIKTLPKEKRFPS